jgi:hypothetical protein
MTRAFKIHQFILNSLASSLCQARSGRPATRPQSCAAAAFYLGLHWAGARRRQLSCRAIGMVHKKIGCTRAPRSFGVNPVSRRIYSVVS